MEVKLQYTITFFYVRGGDVVIDKITGPSSIHFLTKVSEMYFRDKGGYSTKSKNQPGWELQISDIDLYSKVGALRKPVIKAMRDYKLNLLIG